MANITLKTSTRECIPDNYFLGFEGENKANKLVFRFADGFIEGTAQLNIERGKDKGFLLLDRIQNTYQLPIKSSLLSEFGDIDFQFQITKADETVIKYERFIMTVDDAIDTDTQIPEEYPSWIESANAQLAQLNSAISNCQKVSNQLLQDKANGVFDGKDGVNGKDGFSPKAKVTQTSVGAEIEITDRVGTTTAIVRNGEDGKTGAAGNDGFSPIAKVYKTTNGAMVEIQDKNGFSFAELYNGKDGQDGFSPTAGVYPTSEGAMISITDKNGMTAVSIKNGKDLTNPSIQTLFLPILETNSLYRGTIDSSIAFSLPQVTDNTILNTIQLQVVISNYENISIDLGTTKYFGDIPELGNGSYILYYEYDGSNWCVGALPVVSEV